MESSLESIFVNKRIKANKNERAYKSLIYRLLYLLQSVIYLSNCITSIGMIYLQISLLHEIALTLQIFPDRIQRRACFNNYFAQS